MNIVFSQVKGSPDLTFVEIEDDEGRSISVSTWSTRADGARVLSIPDHESTLDSDERGAPARGGHVDE